MSSADLRLLTASKFGLAARCSYWLRGEVAHEERASSQAADEGTELHAAIEAELHGEVLPPSGSPVVAAKLAAWRAWATRERRIGWRPEIAYAYDAKSDSARELVQTGHRDYSDARPGEVAMTLDVVSMGEDTAGPYAVVIDWKSGQHTDGALPQVSLGALAVSRALGVDRVLVRVVYLAEDGVTPEDAWLEAFDLDMVRADVLRVVEQPDPEPRPGGHCTGLYCPARLACPATVQALAEVVQVEPAAMARLVADAITTPEAAGAAYVRLRAVKDAVKAIDERIRAVVEACGEAPTSGGKRLRLVTTTRETFSRGRLPKESAEAILAQLRDVGALAESTSAYLKEVSR